MMALAQHSIDNIGFEEVDDWEENVDLFLSEMETQKREISEKQLKEEKRQAKLERIRLKESMNKEKELQNKKRQLYESYKTQLRDAEIYLDLLNKPDDGIKLDMSSQWSSSINLDDVIHENKSYEKKAAKMIMQSRFRQKEYEKAQKEKEAKAASKKQSLINNIAKLNALIISLDMEQK
jgi:hypothetical protein